MKVTACADVQSPGRRGRRGRERRCKAVSCADAATQAQDGANRTAKNAMGGWPQSTCCGDCDDRRVRYYCPMVIAEAAEALASTVRCLDRRPDLVLEDAFGPYRYRVYFEVPCTDAVSALLQERGFRWSHSPRTPHDPESDDFVNRDLSTGISFSDPAVNPHTTLWPKNAPVPHKSELEVQLDELLASRT